jgi:16S rRNA (cytosine967-C5)-methyltransferase
VITTARATAAKILVRALEEGAFAAAALDAERARNLDLDVRDRALVTELVFGTLRYREGLLLALKRQAKKLPDGLVLTHILLAMYQLVFLDRVPGFAAVNEAVQNIRALRGAQVAGFANAVLRAFARRLEANRVAEQTLIENASVPEWVRTRLVASVGESAAQSLYAPGQPPVALAIGPDANRETVLTALREARPLAQFAASEASPIGITVEHGGDLSQLPGYEQTWIIQELGSQLVAHAASATAKPGARILDACSGRGNKVHALRALVPAAVVHACDLHPAKLEHAVRRGAAQTFAVDWTQGSGAVSGDYDVVLVDAPCSGFGTLRRRPDILLRRRETDLVELAKMQRAILTQSAKHVAIGGTLVYAVCSVLQEEAEAVIDALDADFALQSQMRLLPPTHGTDGYYLAHFHRVR